MAHLPRSSHVDRTGIRGRSTRDGPGGHGMGGFGMHGGRLERGGGFLTPVYVLIAISKSTDAEVSRQR